MLIINYTRTRRDAWPYSVIASRANIRKYKSNILILFSYTFRLSMRPDTLSFSCSSPYAFLFYTVRATCPVTLRSVSSNKKVDRFTDSEKVRCGVRWSIQSSVGVWINGVGLTFTADRQTDRQTKRKFSKTCNLTDRPSLLYDYDLCIYLSFKAQWSLYVPLSGHYMYRTVVTICTAQWSLYVPTV
jgi:hypothetical protein